jgi:putative two-component system hydrogenase maturation factor HypX/HoxX
MRILLLTHVFNSLTQRLGAELRQRGHLVSVEFDINDAVTEEAAVLFAPDLIVAPYLRRAIPESVWSRYLCLIVHPGVWATVALRRWTGPSCSSKPNGV